MATSWKVTMSQTRCKLQTLKYIFIFLEKKIYNFFTSYKNTQSYQNEQNMHKNASFNFFFPQQKIAVSLILGANSLKHCRLDLL